MPAFRPPLPSGPRLRKAAAAAAESSRPQQGGRQEERLSGPQEEPLGLPQQSGRSGRPQLPKAAESCKPWQRGRLRLLAPQQDQWETGRLDRPRLRWFMGSPAHRPHQPA